MPIHRATLVLLLFTSAVITGYPLQAHSAPVIPDTVANDVLQQRTDNAFNDEWDWLQLTSGEWLKGKIKVVYNGEMEFNSAKLGLRKFNLDDIEQVHTLRPQAVRIFGVDKPQVGTITLSERTIEIKNDSLSYNFDRDRVIALVSGQLKELNFWSARFGLGTNIRSGNSPQTEYNGNFSTKRRTALSRFTVDYLGLYTYSDDKETANNHRLRSNFDIFANQRLFYRPLFLDIFSDRFQNIDARGTLGAGLGLQAIDRDNKQWDLFIGPGIQFTQFNEVDEANEKREQSAVLIASTHYNMNVTSAMGFILDYQILWANEASGGYTHHVISTLSYDLTRSIDFNTSIVWDYIESPTPDDLGTTPKNDDYRFIFSISYSFN